MLYNPYVVQGFPTLKFFAPGSKHPQDYPGERTAAAMVSFCTDQWTRHAPPPEVRCAPAACALSSVQPAQQLTGCAQDLRGQGSCDLQGCQLQDPLHGQNMASVIHVPCTLTFA